LGLSIGKEREDGLFLCPKDGFTLLEANEIDGKSGLLASIGSRSEAEDRVEGHGDMGEIGYLGAEKIAHQST